MKHNLVLCIQIPWSQRLCTNEKPPVPTRSYMCVCACVCVCMHIHPGPYGIRTGAKKSIHKELADPVQCYTSLIAFVRCLCISTGHCVVTRAFYRSRTNAKPLFVCMVQAYQVMKTTTHIRFVHAGWVSHDWCTESVYRRSSKVTA